MDPIGLQQQVRQNSDDLASYYQDLKNWGEEMKQKEEILKSSDSRKSSKVTAVKSEKLEVNSKTSKKKKVPMSSIDYTAWDKYDADAECAKLDKNTKEPEVLDEDSSELSDESDESSVDQANCEKEKGNAFVKNQKWDKAIVCYTKAIEYYAYNPIFYANRALCHLKTSNYLSAEVDCTTALKLDKTYVKAYQRRAAAREALNKHVEARADLLKVFDYEPCNNDSKKALGALETKMNALKDLNKKNEQPSKIVEKPTEESEKSLETQRPKSIFTASRQNKKVVQKRVIEPSNIPQDAPTYWPSGNEIELLHPTEKAPHLRSKKPLKRINVRDIKIDTIPQFENDGRISIETNKLKVIEHIENSDKVPLANIVSSENEKNTKKLVEKVTDEKEEFNFMVPKTAVQFYNDWKNLKNNLEWKYRYLKQIDPSKFVFIFRESLESDIFSEIISTLSQTFISKQGPIYDYLIGLTRVKRFSMLVMFMSQDDKTELLKLSEYLKADYNISKSNLNELLNKYCVC